MNKKYRKKEKRDISCGHLLQVLIALFSKTRQLLRGPLRKLTLLIVADLVLKVSDNEVLEHCNCISTKDISITAQIC